MTAGSTRAPSAGLSSGCRDFLSRHCGLGWRFSAPTCTTSRSTAIHNGFLSMGMRAPGDVLFGVAAPCFGREK